MEAGELRIGNYIRHKNLNLFRVDEIRLSEHGYDVAMYSAFPESLKSSLIMPLSEAKSIVLTDEILLRCGFSHFSEQAFQDDHTYNYYVHDQKFLVKSHKRVPNTIYLCSQKTQKITTLHQLQNICFEVHRIELNIDI